MSTLRAQSAMFDRVIDSIVRPARRVVETPEAPRPDLAAVALALAADLEAAAAIVETGFPATAQLYIVKARAARAAVAIAAECRHV